MSLRVVGDVDENSSYSGWHLLATDRARQFKIRR